MAARKLERYEHGMNWLLKHHYHGKIEDSHVRLFMQLLKKTKEIKSYKIINDFDKQLDYVEIITNRGTIENYRFGFSALPIDYDADGEPIGWKD